MGLFGWSAGVVVSAGALVVCAALRSGSITWAWVHMGVAAATGIGFAAAGILAVRRLAAAQAKEQLIAATTARAISMIWIWAALTLAATYATGVLRWWEWWHFTLAAVVVAGLCLFFERTLRADAANPEADDTMMRFAETLAMIQFAGMGVALLGLLIDGKMTRFMTPRYTDWAANSVFFFGALGIAIISAYDILQRRRSASDGT